MRVWAVRRGSAYIPESPYRLRTPLIYNARFFKNEVEAIKFADTGEIIVEVEIKEVKQKKVKK